MAPQMVAQGYDAIVHSFLLLISLAGAAEITVSPRGPVRTIQAAIERLPAGERNTIVVAAGDYWVTAPLELDSRHDGLKIVAKGAARLLGGAGVGSWKKEGAVLVADLPFAPAGLTSRGFSRDTAPAHSELFVAGKRMTLARWPNEGEFARIASTADPSPPDDGHGRPLGRIEHGFHYEGDRPSRWKDVSGVWVHGYWAWDLAETYERVERLDAGRRLIVTAPPRGIYGFRGGQRYYFVNVREELDSPGEYFVDAAARKVYLWPPEGFKAAAEAVVTSLGEPFVRIRGAADITIEGLTFAYSRGNGIEVHDSRNVRLSRLTVSGVGNNGVIIRGGEGNRLEYSHVSGTGDGGLELTGGDRAKLTPGRHAAEDNHFHDFGEWCKTYNPAVRINGVGNVLAHNNIHDAPHAGILLTGNDHRIEYNELHHLAKETGDVGAFYLGRDYTERGNVVRYNYFHHLGGVGSIGSMAVYLDDCASGTEVRGNVFYKVQRAAFIGGGRDNVVENNLFVECSTAVHVDSRGLSPRPVWQNMVYQTMKPKVEAAGELYRQRYPALVSVLPFLEKTGGVPPEGNRIRRNIVFGPGSDAGKWLGLRERAGEFATDMGDNWAQDAIGVRNPEAGDFTLGDGNRARAIGFEPIPWREIGPRKR